MRAFHEIREYTSGLEVWHGRYDNIGIIAHWHTETELVMVKAGCCVMHVNSRRIEAKAGDLVVIRSGDIHYCDEHSADLALEFLIFSPEVLKSSMRGIHPASGIIPAELVRERGLSRDWEELTERTDEELAAKDLYYSECVRLMISAFYCRLLRASGFPAAAVSAEGNQTAARLPEVFGFMEEHCGEKLTLETVSAYAGFSGSYLSRIFKQYAGIGYVEYLNLLRVSRALELLGETGRKVIDVAAECGFGNIRTFNRVFLKYTGRTPTAFRQNPGGEGELFLPLRSYTQYTTNEERNPTVAV